MFGGAGFIGSHLLRSLAMRGYSDLVSVDLRPPHHPVQGVRYDIHDIRNPIPNDLADSQPYEVYNLAAVHRTPGHPDHEYFDTNVPGTVNVCAYCQNVGVKRLAFTSSIAVYGPSETPKSESSALELT